MTLSELTERYPGAETFRFGDSEALSSRLLSLVRSGRKRATCGALRDFGPGGEVRPSVGRCDIALDWHGNPAIVVRTIDVKECRFCDVDADFALAEGENETLDGWRRDHRDYFERNGGWSEDMQLLCERFEVVEVLERGA
ncbi:MAG: ASCH domain-containing protein [Rhodobacteraceae bacterium]|nr:ASCH domain-containing protein [Paracoccaceae bacterium]